MRRALIGMLLAAAALPAGAESPPVAETEQITVTATRRTTVLQRTPIAITAAGARQLEDAGVRDIRDLTQLAPSLAVPVSENSASVTARIRGIGTQGSNPGLESAVGVFVDGVYRARNGVAFGDLGELERVEILRGPQGTLFGRNTSAGTIHAITRAPSFEPEAAGALSAGSFGLHGATAALSGPLVEERLAGRLYAGGQSRDGWVEVNPGTPAARAGNAQRSFIVRGQLLYEAEEALRLRLIADFSRRDEECCTAGTVRPGGPGRFNFLDPAYLGPLQPAPHEAVNLIAGPGAKAAVNTIGSQIAYANRPYGLDVRDGGVSVEAEAQTGLGLLTLIGAAREWKFVNGQDNDFSRADVLYRVEDGGNFMRFRTFSAEARLTGSAGALDWLLGAYGSRETILRRDAQKTGADHERLISLYRFGGPDNRQTLLLNELAGLLGDSGPAAVTTAGGGVDDVFRQEADSFALFTHNTLALSDRLALTLGARWTREEKRFRAAYATSGAPGCAYLEGVLGLNPGANVSGLPLTAAQRTLATALVNTGCLPWQRRALDGVDHRQARSESEWSGVATAAYTLAPGALAYATYARGYKAGGFNLDRAFGDRAGSIVSGPVGAQSVRGPDTGFPAETVDAFELGLKTAWLDGALTVNLAAYHQRFSNYQLNTFTGIGFLVTPIPRVNAQGVELEAAWRTPLDGLSLAGGAAWTDARYDESYRARILADPGALGAQVFLPGARLTSAPEWTWTGAATWRAALGGGLALLAHADVRWTSEQVTGSNLDPAKTQAPYALVNARMGLGPEDESVMVELWARNLLDERTFQIAFDSPLQGPAPTLNASGVFVPGASHLDAFFNEPLTAGLTLRVRW